jgi:hypothetical protein
MGWKTRLTASYKQQYLHFLLLAIIQALLLLHSRPHPTLQQTKGTTDLSGGLLVDASAAQARHSTMTYALLMLLAHYCC